MVSDQMVHKKTLYFQLTVTTHIPLGLGKSFAEVPPKNIFWVEQQPLNLTIWRNSSVMMKTNCSCFSWFYRFFRVKLLSYESRNVKTLLLLLVVSFTFSGAYINQEETDTGVILHLKYAAQKGCCKNSWYRYLSHSITYCSIYWYRNLFRYWFRKAASTRQCIWYS